MSGERVLRVVGAVEHNLRDVDVEFGGGLTAVVGVSGSGKSSLVFDTVQHEARRRFLQTLALGSPWLRMPPARVRRIDGLGPAVAVEQNTLNRNPQSTVATATGMHPFLRVLFARFAEVSCPACARPVRARSDEERVAVALGAAPGPVDVPLVRGVRGSHARLLALLADRFGPAALTVDGRAWSGRPLDPAAPHDVTVRTGQLAAGATARDARSALAAADGLGCPEVVVGGVSVLRAPVCPGCGGWVPPLEPTAFTDPAATGSHTVGGATLVEVLRGNVAETRVFLRGAELGPAARPITELVRRLDALHAVGLDHLTLDRPMPTLSRGEAQRVRIAVVLANRIEDLLHVLDEPTIGLHHRDVARVLAVLDRLPGPVLMVEHDVAAVAHADEVVELGPGPGPHGGRLVFQGPPAALWSAGTASGRAFSGAAPVPRPDPRPAPAAFLVVRAAEARNLAGFDCRFPVGRLTAVTGPSGAGKSTLVRDVLLASLGAAVPAGCAAVDGPRLRSIAVGQSPLGNNPRSNPATYTKLHDRIRARFAAETGLPAAAFSFNRPEGACPECAGMGAVEVRLRYLYPTWIPCDACGGTRFRPEVLAARASLGGRELSISDLLELGVEQARPLLVADRDATRILTALSRVGLGYLPLGQPSPTLSGGEAQRVRLARELARARTGDLVVLDEPTTGLHPADLERLLDVLAGLLRRGCTVVVVEHQPDVIAAADWVVELGPGGGPDGGRLLHDGPPTAGRPTRPRPRAQPRRRARAATAIRIRGARANNLRDVSVDLPKGALTVVTGVSGSGKSSLVGDVLEAEAMRRLLECLSMYERQSVREGPEAPVRSIDGLGPTLTFGTEHRVTGTTAGVRATVGSASEVGPLVATALARAGARRCVACGAPMAPAAGSGWRCDRCGRTDAPLEPRLFSPATYAAACLRCAGVGELREPIVERLVVRPDRTICGGALHSPGYYPRNYLCTPGTGGYAGLQAMAARYGFDPAGTPWQELTADAQRVFLFGDPEPYSDGTASRRWRGVFTELSTWDVGGLYTRAVGCPDCGGGRLRPEYLAVTLGGWSRRELHEAPLRRLAEHLRTASVELGPAEPAVADAVSTAVRRLDFLHRVGLGYLTLDRQSATLSAGEAQRVRLASVLGGGLGGMTVLLDEPSRGLHPSEVDALAGALGALRDAGNTVVVVEHDPVVLGAADHVLEIGPGPGPAGGRVVASGPPATLRRGVTADLLAGRVRFPLARRTRREPVSWLTVRGAREHNLSGADVRIPLGVLAGLCGVSGSGKSTLGVDTIGRALAPPRLTTSVAYERYDPGEHDRIDGAPDRVVVADQARAGITAPGSWLGILPALHAAFADSDAALAAGLEPAEVGRACDACAGRGGVVESMGFLPSLTRDCDACAGTGYAREARDLTVRGRTLAETTALTLAELAEAWGDVDRIGRACSAAAALGLGYLVVRQPSWSLSGGEVQRLKLARELTRRQPKPALYLLDEPTVGLHALDVARLAAALDQLVDAGHSVLVVEHHPDLLACCDWLTELGPGGGPAGGRVVAAGTPEQLAAGDTATAPWLRQALR